MKKIMQHVLNKSDKKDKMDGRVSDKDKAAGASALAQHPIPSLARMSASLSRKSIGGLSTASEAPKVRIGICAMDKKARSKPMKEIVNRLMAYGEFEMIYFGDEMILHAPIEEWPEADVLLSWYSDGFPLAKAQAYAELRGPFLVNDLHKQDILQDRRKVYELLEENNIPLPTHIVVNRDGLASGADPEGFIEEEDYVELNGLRIDKPFVEKPASGEDHNIHIYYPHSMGGGVKRLFRKVNDKSSCYDPHHPGNVRRDGSYIYEEFLATGGTDVKVYTVGPRYAHAEARKSPVVDGKVLRAADGKEMRFPVLLTPQEKEIARMVTLAFAQKVCGFDLLRSEKGKSYVCDVNGWSFVKSSKKYYDDAAGILRRIILAAIAPHRLNAAPAPGLRSSHEADGAAEDDDGRGTMSKVSSLQDLAEFGTLAELSAAAELSKQELASLINVSGWDAGELNRTEKLSAQEELRCVLAVIRHGDRTPKQKMKVRVTQPELLQLFHKYKDSKGKQAKLKSPNQLQELLDITRNLLAQLERPPSSDATEEELEQREEMREKFRIVRTVLEQGGQFSGINRKVQLKPVKWATPAVSAAAAADGKAADGDKADAESSAGSEPAEGDTGGPTNSANNSTNGSRGKGDVVVDGAEAAAQAVARSGGEAGQEKQKQKAGSGASGKGGEPVLEEALMILKYGGVLTHAGRQQAEDLGRIFRLVMYPRYGAAGGGLLRLHSTYRHDLKIYSSDEGRVQSSAAAFTKGLIDLEGSSLTPILVSLVQKDASMLDAFGKGASEDIKRAKNILYTTMTWDPNDKYHSVPPSMSLTPSAVSPPLTPNPYRCSSSTGGTRDGSGTAAAATAAGGGGVSGGEVSQDEEAVGAAVPPASSVAAAAVAAALEDGRSARGRTLTAGSVASSVTDMSYLDTASEQGQSEGVSASSLATAAAAGGVSAPMPPGHSASGSSPLWFPQNTGGPRLSYTGTISTAPSAEISAAGGSAAGEGPRSDIPGMPDNPLQHLKRLNNLMKLLVDQLRDMCVRERPGSSAGAEGRYSSLSQDPKDWRLDPDRPCSGERLLLMFDRWQKLAKSFYKKGRFDISKVPDIYDSAKYDAIHNAHLDLAVLPELYQEARKLANAVIPNEYGIDPVGKLTIGSKICAELLGKLLSDLESMRIESRNTMAQEEHLTVAGGENDDIGRESLQDEAMLLRSYHAGGDEAEAEELRAEEPELIHRLCPMYASDINSPLRHVRTRIYFTSESHMHSLLNVLRYSHLGNGSSNQHGASATSSRSNSLSRGVSGIDGPATSAAAAAAGGGGSGGSAGSRSSAGAGGVWTVVAPANVASAASVADLPTLTAAVSGADAASGEGQSVGGGAAAVGVLVPAPSYVNLPPLAPGGGAAVGKDGGDPKAVGPSASGLPSAFTGVGGAGAGPSTSTTGNVSSGSGGNGGGGIGGGSLNGGSAGTAQCVTPGAPPQKKCLLSEESYAMLRDTPELDYLTHLVIRMYENKAVPADHPERFRIEVLFSPGAGYNPIEYQPPRHNHTLPAKPRVPLHTGDGISWKAFRSQLMPYASTKRQPCPAAYELTVGLKAPSPQVAKRAAGALG